MSTIFSVLQKQLWATNRPFFSGATRTKRGKKNLYGVSGHAFVASLWDNSVVPSIIDTAARWVKALFFLDLIFFEKKGFSLWVRLRVLHFIVATHPYQKTTRIRSSSFDVCSSSTCSRWAIVLRRQVLGIEARRGTSWARDWEWSDWKRLTVCIFRSTA